MSVNRYELIKEQEMGVEREEKKWWRVKWRRKEMLRQREKSLLWTHMLKYFNIWAVKMLIWHTVPHFIPASVLPKKLPDDVSTGCIGSPSRICFWRITEKEKLCSHSAVLPIFPQLYASDPVDALPM